MSDECVCGGVRASEWKRVWQKKKKRLLRREEKEKKTFQARHSRNQPDRVDWHWGWRDGESSSEPTSTCSTHTLQLLSLSGCVSDPFGRRTLQKGMEWVIITKEGPEEQSTFCQSKTLAVLLATLANLNNGNRPASEDDVSLCNETRSISQVNGRAAA